MRLRSPAAVLAAAAVSCTGAAPPPPTPVVVVPRSLPAPAPSAEPVAAAAPAPPEPPGPCFAGTPVPEDKVGAPLHGSFSAPNVDEILGTLHCAPDGNDLGGLALLRRTEGVLRTVRFDPHVDYRSAEPRCSVLRTSEGRDLAICQGGSFSYGVVLRSVAVLDYARPEEQEWSLLVRVGDDTETACAGQTDLAMGSLERVELVDVNHDGWTDVRITVRAAKVRVPKQPPCENTGAVSNTPSAPLKLPQAPRVVLDFVARGATLVATPATAAAAKRIMAMGPQ